MIWLLSLTALAGAPKGVDIDDPDPWEARSRRAIAGPADQCWSITGATTVTVKLHQPPRIFSRVEVSSFTREGTFNGILDKGTWTRFDVTLTENGVPSEASPMVRPLVGQVKAGAVRNTNKPVEPKPTTDASKPDADPPPDDSISIGLNENGELDVETSSGKASKVLLDLVDGAWSDMPSTSFVQWNDEISAVQLVVEAPLQESAPNDLVRTLVRFPDGSTVPTAIDTELPKRVSAGKWPVRARLLSAQLHVRGVPVDGHFLPSLETLSGVLGVVGFTFGYDQRIVYHQATPCDAVGPMAQ